MSFHKTTINYQRIDSLFTKAALLYRLGPTAISIRASHIHRAVKRQKAGARAGDSAPAAVHVRVARENAPLSKPRKETGGRSFPAWLSTGVRDEFANRRARTHREAGRALCQVQGRRKPV